jgi:hypothetical protein
MPQVNHIRLSASRLMEERIIALTDRLEQLRITRARIQEEENQVLREIREVLQASRQVPAL